MQGPTNPASEAIHAEKYRGKGEQFREAMCRIANDLKDSDMHYHQFRDIIGDMRFLAAGRVQASIGSTKSVTPYNCFVSGTIEDSFVAGNGSIMARATEAAATMRMGGGIGYDFSTLRPRGDRIKKLESNSTGPVSFMDIYDSICRCTSSTGHRRGAQMGVLRVDHPDIEEFIRAKQNSHALTGFNVSVAITDEFMYALETGAAFALKFGGSTYKEIDAEALWNMIMRSTYDWAEPGVLFIDTINRMNNLKYCETIAATNPCGEQPLPPYGACLLGSFNLTRYIGAVEGGGFSFDWMQFMQDIPPVVRAMDNVCDRALFPLYEQEKEAKSKRRMGLGITGYANAVEALGHPYGSPAAIEFLKTVLLTLNVGAYETSVKLAREKGAFPLYSEKYLDSEFLDIFDGMGIKEDIKAHGIRNSHLTSIAPTGTISLSADNVSSGIEPVFSYTQERKVIMPDQVLDVVVPDYGYNRFGVEGKRTVDVTPDEHINTLTAAAKYVDSAVSKTCNVDTDLPFDDFKNMYLDAWKGGAKGCTTYRPVEGGRGAVLVSADEETEKGANEHCEFDPVTGKRDCS